MRSARSAVLALTAVMFSAGCGAPPMQEEALQYLKSSDGSTRAVVVHRDASLLYTAMLLPSDTEVGARDQLADLFAQLDAVLAEGGSVRGDVVKLNIYAASDSAAALVGRELGAFFSDEPAVTLVVGALAESGAALALDAVATTAAKMPIRDDQIANRTVAAVLPPGGRVFVSGQAADRESLRGAVAGTLESLHATLAYLGLSADDVVQLKIFLAPMDSARIAEEVAATYYRSAAPPMVSVEWTNTFRPLEIELVAHRSDASRSAAERASYITPAGMTGSTAFSRVVEVHDGDLIFTSGLKGRPMTSAAGQVAEIFDELGSILNEAGSSYENLIKATYYYTDREARSALGEVRSERYDPTQPPAASLVGTRSLVGSAFALDMIAVSRSSD